MSTGYIKQYGRVGQSGQSKHTLIIFQVNLTFKSFTSPSESVNKYVCIVHVLTGKHVNTLMSTG